MWSLNALRAEIERAEAGLPPLLLGDQVERLNQIKNALPGLGAQPARN